MPMVGRAKFLHDSFCGEGDEDLPLTSLGGRRPYIFSFPFKRGGDGDRIVLGLLRHAKIVDVGVIDGGRQRLEHWKSAFLRLEVCPLRLV